MPAHLVVLIHGLWAFVSSLTPGSPEHLAEAKSVLEETYHGTASTTHIHGPSSDPTIESTSARRGDDRLVVMIAGGMSSKLTYDGIDVCASRVAWEVDRLIAELEAQGIEVDQFSVSRSPQTGYSLGGLVARYLVGLLESDESFFRRHKPVSFSTIATPHLGVPRYNTVLSTVLCWLGARLLSRSGEQLYVADSYADGRPLLEVMADPDEAFNRALRRFKRIEIFANAVNDHTVPYPSAAIETVDHFAEFKDRNFRRPTPPRHEKIAIRTLRRVEEELEVDFLEEPDYDEDEYDDGSNVGSAAPTTPHVVTTRVHLKPSQLRMASWLNSLPLEKYLTWFPDVANTHSLIVVRDPLRFPVQLRGRGVLMKWARGVLGE
ncbi:LOW QUALITY PROTEIN: hypothetical protein JCM24511_06995 [Saitozyma sp. JCM 24511]|nr:LOW QUALITY PROTEIN: hypothetical protein JCM24511_06995 [Saitozyma sp. JCM 24511]